jgi:hypothetical protein
MLRKAILMWIFLGTTFFSPGVEAADTAGELWIHNRKTPNGNHYLNGFVRGYIEGRRWGIETMEAILPYAEIDPSTRIDKEQLESRFFMETLHDGRSVEESSLENIIHQVTRWYEDPRNWEISWTKLVDLAIGKVHGFHAHYIEYEIRWLQESSTHKRIDWYHGIDPATGEGRVTYHDKNGQILRVEWVK